MLWCRRSASCSYSPSGSKARRERVRAPRRTHRSRRDAAVHWYVDRYNALVGAASAISHCSRTKDCRRSLRWDACESTKTGPHRCGLERGIERQRPWIQKSNTDWSQNEKDSRAKRRSTLLQRRDRPNRTKLAFETILQLTLCKPQTHCGAQVQNPAALRACRVRQSR